MVTIPPLKMVKSVMVYDIGKIPMKFDMEFQKPPKIVEHMELF